MGFIRIAISLLEKIFFARCWLIYVRKWSFDVCSISLLSVSFRRLKFPYRVRIERAHSIRAYRSSSGIFIAFDRPFIRPSSSALQLFRPYLTSRASFANGSRVASEGAPLEDRKGTLDCSLDLSSFPFKPLPFSVALTLYIWPQKKHKFTKIARILSSRFWAFFLSKEGIMQSVS